MLKLQNVTKSIQGTITVSDVNFELEKGEFFSILGPSGCGKTTLLRILAGLDTPTSGQLLLDGKDISQLPPQQRPFNLVFQKYALFPHLNVFNNIAFGLKIKGLSRAEIATRVDEALDIIRMRSYSNRRISELSGGEQQRVAIARAIINKPRLLLLDEPLSALDLKLRESMQLELRHLQKSLGISFLFVTHDQSEALTMSDRIAVMSQGKVLQIASPQDIYLRPNHEFVAGFIGTMNKLPCKVARAQEKSEKIRVVIDNLADETEPLELQVGDFATPGLQQQLDRFDSTSVGQWVNSWLMVRPESLQILPSPGSVGAKSNSHFTSDDHRQVYFEGAITHSVFKGQSVELGVKMPSLEQNIQFSVSLPRDHFVKNAQYLHEGNQVKISWDVDDCVILPRQQ